MKTAILCKQLYRDIDSLSNLITTMDYTESIYGNEIKDFYYIPDGLQEQFSKLVDEPIEIQPNSGVFRKPFNIIHFENFYQHARWMCVVALENTTLKLHEKGDISTFFDVKTDITDFVSNNCIDNSTWSETATLNIKQNDYIFIRPWLWHSLEQNKLIQVFLLNQQLKD